jgi:hypothetical protein
MAWALHAVRRVLQLQQIGAAILKARDLSKKGGPRRQLEYVRRTARKAVASVILDLRSGPMNLQQTHTTERERALPSGDQQSEDDLWTRKRCVDA